MQTSKTLFIAASSLLAPLALGFAPAAQAAIETLDLTSPVPTNGPTLGPISGSTVDLTISNPVSTKPPSTGAVNSNAVGFCAWLQNGPSFERCGYVAGNGSDATSNFTGFKLKFSKSLTLKSFDVSQFDGITAGGFSFTRGSRTESFNVTGLGTQTFTSPFHVAAGSSVTVTSTGGPGDGVMRLSSLTVDTNGAAVPGPLPLLGAGAAFGWSRRLRRRTTGAALPKQAG